MYIWSVSGCEYGEVSTAPPVASHRPVSIGGSVQPRFANVITALPWVCTMAPISGRYLPNIVCIRSSEVAGFRPSTWSPSRVTMAMSAGSSRSYWVDAGVQASSPGSAGMRMLMLPAVE